MPLFARLAWLVGPTAIVICMLLRSTDVFFRSGALRSIPPLELITWEHLIACLVLVPWFPGFAPLRRLNLRGWLTLLFVACGASVGGILCFTTAFTLINPAVVILLQKLQPVITIGLSLIFLREKIARAFYPLAAVAVLSGYVLVFGFSIPDMTLHGNQLTGAVLALAATALWGGGTAFGKYLLATMDPPTLTRYRYFFGLVFALILAGMGGMLSSPAVLSHPTLLLNIGYMALVPGMVALFFFYSGLKTTPASIASILELTFPVASVVIAWVFLDQRLQPLQIGAAVVLLATIVGISRLNRA